MEEQLSTMAHLNKWVPEMGSGKLSSRLVMSYLKMKIKRRTYLDGQ